MDVFTTSVVYPGVGVACYGHVPDFVFSVMIKDSRNPKTVPAEAG
jgi:hypothetical protein